MTRDETRQIREAAIEDKGLTQCARLLLMLVIDFHHKRKGCVLFDSTIADKLGVSTRTVERRRKELMDAGYLQELHGANRRELVPTAPDSGDISPDTDDVEDDTRDETPDTDVGSAPDTDDVHREINNPEGASVQRAREDDRWAFLPDYRQRWLPEIRSEAGKPDHTPDLLAIAERFLGDTDVDLPTLVDDHQSRRSDDEIIAAYVIAGRSSKVKDPAAYADTIIREGWKQSGGDGTAMKLPDDQDVIHFGSTRA